MISIIIPVYNAERYISRCIDSIIKQSFVDWELILIDDGSKDLSGSICDRYASENNQIRVFHRENSGVSSARNYGIEQAVGKWIWFIDSDDYLLEGAKEVIEEAIKKNSSAIALSFIQEIDDNHAYPYLATCELGKGVYSGNRMINTKSTSPTVWSFLFRRDIILRYKLQMSSELKFGEDKIFILEYLSHVENVLVLETPVYQYVFCKTSAVRQNYMKNEREIDDQLKSILVLLVNSKRNGIDCGIFRAQILYIVTQFILLCSSSELGYSVCKKKYSEFVEEICKVGYSSWLLNFIKIGLRVFYNHPYWLKRRFLFFYFHVNRQRYGLGG